VSPAPPLPTLSAAPVTIRHITRATTGTTVVGATLAAQPSAGVNGRRGYQTGVYEPALSEDGTAKITLPNGSGSDGVLHRERFAVYTDPGYLPGDEWVEVWQDNRVLFVGTPIGGTKGRPTLTLDLADGAGGLLPVQREFAAGFWTHAPRDAFEHYTKAWQPIVADDFDAGADATAWNSSGANNPGFVRLAPVGAGAVKSLLAVSGQWPALVAATTRAWRLETTFRAFALAHPMSSFYLFLGGTDGGFAQIRLYPGYAEATALSLSAGTPVVVTVPVPPATIVTGAAIESRDRWILFYINGALLTTIESPFSSPGVEFLPGINVTNSSTGSSVADIDAVLLRAAVPYLMRGADKGDYRLPGSPTPGGLKGSYYDEADLRSLGDTTVAFYGRVQSPTRTPYARRQDPTINFATGTPPTWQPAGPPGGLYFSARWTGSIYLDLEAADVTLRLASVDNGARLYVGKTMFGQELLAQWANPTGAPYTLTSGSLRTHLETGRTGWYPIRLEYIQGIGSGGIILQQSIAGAAYAVVPSTSLSPYGIYEAEVRYDSHAEQIRTLVETFGLQYRVEPRSLESGLFPGEMVPRVRVGRDTDKVLEPPESTDATVQISARDSVTALLADAAGLADQANAAQLTTEVVNFAALWPSTTAARHIAVASGYESLAEITDPNLLRTRLASLLTLRSSPWEEVGARPRGHREMRDTFPPMFPMPGALAMFDWEPGDGIQLRDDELGLRDDSPRQIIAPQWPFGPDGRGSPNVRFRQRPRSQQDALRQLIRAVLLPQRNYQGQLVVVNGSLGASPATAYADIYSRVSLPTDLATIVGATLVLQAKGDTSAGTITVNGTATPLTAQVADRYDITPYVARITGEQRMYINLSGHTSIAEYMVELLIRT
jgi:hypothetical protein